MTNDSEYVLLKYIAGVEQAQGAIPDSGNDGQ